MEKWNSEDHGTGEALAHYCGSQMAVSSLLDELRAESQVCDACATKHKKFADLVDEIESQNGLFAAMGAAGMQSALCLNQVKFNTSPDLSRAEKAKREKAVAESEKIMLAKPRETVMPAVIMMITKETIPMTDLQEGRVFRIPIAKGVQDNTYRNVIDPGDEGEVVLVSKDENYAYFTLNAIYVNGKAYPAHHEKGRAVLVKPQASRIPRSPQYIRIPGRPPMPTPVNPNAGLAEKGGVLKGYDLSIILEGPIVFPPVNVAK